MKNILFVCAMKKEGEQIAKKLKMKKVNSKLYKTDYDENLYESEDGSKRLLISMIGKQYTAISLTKYLCQYGKPDLVINIGYAGSTDIQIGKWVNISRAYNYEWDIPGEEKYIMSHGGSQELVLLKDERIETVECYSAESFVTYTEINEHVAFDMELHSLSLICDLKKIPLLSIKKISDNLSLNDYYDNLNKDDIFELTSSIDILSEIVDI